MQQDKLTVLSVLQQASSQEINLLKPAEQTLAKWENQAGFYSSLMEIVCDSQCDFTSRWLAVVYLKNGVDRYWRRGAPNVLHEAEKSLIRSRLLVAFMEPIQQLAVQIAVVMGKIARFDCPNHWSDLMPTLMNAVRANDLHTQQRALRALHQVVKAMASKRLATDRKLFEELTSVTFVYIVGLWHEHATSSLNMMSKNDTSLSLLEVEKAIIVLKVLRKLIVFGFREVNQSTEAMQFLRSLFQYIERFLSSKNSSACPSNEQLSFARDKILVLATKLLWDVLDNHTESFAELIDLTLEQALRYCFQQEYRGVQAERLTVNMFNLIRGVLTTDLYRPPKTPGTLVKSSATLVACRAKDQRLTLDVIADITQQLLLDYLPLREAELAEWNEDTERFVTGGEGGDSVKFSLRPATEMLVVSVIKEYHETAAPVLLQLMEEMTASRNCGNDDLSTLLKKDAVYNAIGLASFDLFDDINFDDWFATHLVTELTINTPMYKLIRRRVIWLLGCWLSVRMSQSSRPLLYQSLSCHLTPDEDVVVRLEAALTLKLALDDFAFKEDQFTPFVEYFFSSLFQLLNVVQTELKLHVLRVVNTLMERLGRHVRPYAETLGVLLPQLWSISSEDNMFQCTIVSTLSSVVMALGTSNEGLYGFLLPVIRYSVDISQPQHVYLCEDGLELWLITVQCASCLKSDLLDLFPCLIPVLDFGTENLRVCLQIIEAYILLGQEQFLISYMNSLTAACQQLIPDLKSEGLLLTYKLLETILKLFPAEGSSAVASLIPDVITCILDERDYPDIVAVRLALLARVLYNNQPVFMNSIDMVAQAKNQTSANVLANLLDVWLTKIENIILPETKKLSIMAILTLLPSDQRLVLERFGAIINGCVETLYALQRTSPDTVSEEDLVSEEGDNENVVEEQTPHELRAKELLQRDLLYHANLRQFVTERLTLCEQYFNNDQFAQLMQNVDIDVSRQLSTLLSNQLMI